GRIDRRRHLGRPERHRAESESCVSRRVHAARQVLYPSREPLRFLSGFRSLSPAAPADIVARRGRRDAYRPHRHEENGRLAMAMIGILPDAVDRERAASTFDRNVVVTAGAGTGKTHLLVERLMHLLMREPEIKLTDVVALTFTNKAAAEIKLRLRERLEAYVAA